MPRATTKAGLDQGRDQSWARLLHAPTPATPALLLLGFAASDEPPPVGTPPAALAPVGVLASKVPLAGRDIRAAEDAAAVAGMLAIGDKRVDAPDAAPALHPGAARTSPDA